MKVNDIISGKINFEPLNKEKKGKVGISEQSKTDTKVTADTLSLQKTASSELLKVRDMQDTFFKGTASQEGFNELKSIIQNFEKLPEDQKDWTKLSQDLKSAVSRTLYNGESIISYLSTNVKDEKSLYTLKANLDTEIQSTESKIHQARKQIARYLVQESNREAAARFSPTQTLEKIVTDLDINKGNSITKGLNNIQKLLHNES